MKILTLNCGSSSVKYLVYDWKAKETLATGIVERVTIGGSSITHKCGGRTDVVIQHECPTHTVAIELILNTLVDVGCGVIEDYSSIDVVGHRVVHGGARFTKSVLIDDSVIKVLKDTSALAPLHNPANIMGIEAALQVLPSIPHCAILDTAWHQTIPEYIYTYAVPHEWKEDLAVRRYGFHGTSFLYTAKRASVLLGRDPFETNLIVAHIGNGASINAIKNGVSFDTSMGLTPLEGLIMGTRSGDIDAGVVFHVIRQTGCEAKELDNILNKKSGILGLTGKWADRRDVAAAAEKGDTLAILAQQAEAYRIKKYIGAYAAALGRVDALVFTAGVGEMSSEIRKQATMGLGNLGIKIDVGKNAIACSRNAEFDITGEGSATKVYVIPTDEELVMAEDSFALKTGTYDIHTKYHYFFESKNYINHNRVEAFERDIERNPGIKNIVAMPPRQ